MKMEFSSKLLLCILVIILASCNTATKGIDWNKIDYDSCKDCVKPSTNDIHKVI